MVWLLLLFCGEGLLAFHDGGTLAFQAYSRSGDQLLVATTDGAFVSVPAARVRRIQEAAATGDVASAAPGAQATWQPLGADAATSEGDFIIQRLDVKEVSLIDLLRFMADLVGFNLYIDGSVKDTRVTYLFKNIPSRQALQIMLDNAGLAAEMQHGSVSVR